MFNTIERDVSGNVNVWYPNRCRFSHDTNSPFPAQVPDNVAAAVSSAWLEGGLEWTIGASTAVSDKGSI